MQGVSCFRSNYVFLSFEQKLFPFRFIIELIVFPTPEMSSLSPRVLNNFAFVVGVVIRKQNEKLCSI